MSGGGGTRRLGLRLMDVQTAKALRGGVEIRLAHAHKTAYIEKKDILFTVDDRTVHHNLRVHGVPELLHNLFFQGLVVADFQIDKPGRFGSMNPVLSRKLVKTRKAGIKLA